MSVDVHDPNHLSPPDFLARGDSIQRFDLAPLTAADVLDVQDLDDDPLAGWLVGTLRNDSSFLDVDVIYILG